jgi:hypothetical protein
MTYMVIWLLMRFFLKSSHEPIANYNFRPPHSSAPLLLTLGTAPRPRQSNSSQFPNQITSSCGRLTYQICGNRSHTAANCRRRYQWTNNPGNTTRLSIAYAPPTENMVAAAAVSQPSWFPDTATNYHIQPDTQHLIAVNEYSSPEQLIVGNGIGLHITHIGTGNLSTPNASLLLQNVLCVPAIQKHLLFVQKFTTDNSVFFEFWPNYFLVKDQSTKRILMHSPSEGGVYKCRSYTPTANIASTTTPSLDYWHVHSGHLNDHKLKELAS